MINHYPITRYEDEPETMPFDMIVLNRIEGRTHVQTGIKIYYRVNGTYDKSIRKNRLSRFWINGGVAFKLLGYFTLDHDSSLVLMYERLRKLP